MNNDINCVYTNDDINGGFRKNAINANRSKKGQMTFFEMTPLMSFLVTTTLSQPFQIGLSLHSRAAGIPFRESTNGVF